MDDGAQHGQTTADGGPQDHLTFTGTPAGNLYLRMGPLAVAADELQMATTVLGQVFGPDRAPCVALVPDPAKVAVLARMLAGLLTQLPDTHPHKPVGVLLTTAASDEALKAARGQIADMNGQILVVYDVRRGRGDVQGADVLRQVCQDHGAGYVMATTPSKWASMVDVGLDEPFPYESLVVRYPGPSPADVARVLRYQAGQLADYHGVRVPELALEQLAGADPQRLPEGLEPFPGRPLDRLTLARKHLNQRTTHALFSAAAPGRMQADTLASVLSEHVIGQDRVVTTLSEQVTLGLSGLRLRTDRPASALLLAGPTGTGKTLLATTLAAALGAPLIRVDLAAYVRPDQIATLLGSPPGYIGSDRQTNWLTTRVDAAPNGVLLLDELDKCDPRLWAPLLMELLGAGTLTDETGRTVSCRRLHVVLTANAGARDLTGHPTGFGQASSQARHLAAAARVRHLLPDELFNRLDDVLVLDPVDAAMGSAILASALQQLCTQVATAGYTVHISTRARGALLARGVHPSDGARRLHRTLEQLILTPLLQLAPGSYQVVRSGQGVRVQPDATCGRGHGRMSSCSTTRDSSTQSAFFQ